MSDTIFGKIVRGEAPAHKIYEDEHNLAFLNTHPVQPGHVLLIPKDATDRLEDLPEDEYLSLMKAAKHLMHHMRSELGAQRICLKVEGFAVAHVHVHLIPCSSEDDFAAQPREATQDDLAAMAEKLRQQ